jgi:hypothetical protein
MRNAPSVRGLLPDLLDNGDLYWNQLAERHAEHRRNAIVLGVVTLLLMVAGITLGPLAFALAIVIGAIALIQLWLMRRSRP